MDPDSQEKRPVRLSIYNQEFSLRVPAADAADLEHAANAVDELMTTIARSGNMDAARVATLACLHLQDRIQTLERELAQIESRFADRTRRLAEMLDQAVSE